jgi:ABC-type glycerol-3-phosphate transport system substrate-binding protein
MGKLEDLTKLRKQLDLKDWFPTSWEDGQFNGKYYSVPDRREPYVFFYNKKLFAQAGIKEFPKTMDEFVAAARKLTTGGRFGVGLVGAQDPTLAAYFINFLYAFNGNVLDSKGRIQVANADAIKALTFYTDLYRKHKVTQTSIVGDTREQVRNLFMTGQVAMMIDGLFAVGTFKQLAPNLDWGIGMIPKVSGKKQRCLETGWDTVLFTGGKHQKEAWEFVKFYTQAQNMAQAVVTLPVRKTAFESPRFKDASYDPWKQALAYGQPNPKTKYYERMMLAIGEAVQNALTGKMTPEKALKEAEKQIQQMESGL